MDSRPKILIVDDEPFNVDYLEQELEDLEYDTVSAFNGREALEQVEAESPDVILLDIMMPEMDGFAVLERLKANTEWRDIPVIVISAMNDLDSVIRGIKLGAADYLPKPFNEILLHARIESSLERKRWRDKEKEYLRQVNLLTGAAQAIENKTFTAESVSTVSTREDALGNLARVFQHMAQEIHAREQRLLHQIQQLRLDEEERHKAAQETPAVYIPIDRRLALARNQQLPTQTHGAALFADISGFTPLTEALARELGLQRGAEELTRHLNRVYTTLIEEIHRYGGAVLSFSGDAITCWFDDNFKPETALPTGLRAAAGALAMQTAMDQFETMTTPAGTPITMAIKIAITTGPTSRFLVGNATIQQIEVLAGSTLDELAVGEHLAHRGEILVSAAAATTLEQQLTLTNWRTDADTGLRFAQITGLIRPIEPLPWSATVTDQLPHEQIKPWLLAPVFERIQSGKGLLLAELRTVTALFLQFSGIDYSQPTLAQAKLNDFIKWVQSILTQFNGHLLQLTIGDKGSYLYASFGAPVALENDAQQAVLAALALQTPPPELDFITHIQMGLARGQMRSGSYGSPARRTYGVLGDKTNLAARLMQAAQGSILCDESIYHAAGSQISFETLPPIAVKGKADPVSVYRPLNALHQSNYNQIIDRLPPTLQLTLKVVSLLGQSFQFNLLQAIYPVETNRDELSANLAQLTAQNLIASAQTPETHQFTDPMLQQVAYQLMLFAQRRQLHRDAALWYEQTYAADLSPHYTTLAHHWQHAENIARAVHYLEQAGEQARRGGDVQQALKFYNDALNLEAHGAVLSQDYYQPQ